VSLLMAALAMLAVPLAVRRVIDHGFTAENAGFVDQYFAMMLVIVALLAAGSAGRYYFVTWLGERVVADLRRKVFRHLLSLSPGFYDEHSTGETMSRLTADTTQLKSLFGSSISVALRNLVMLAGSVVMMVVTSIELSGLVLLDHPADRPAAGAHRAAGQAAVARGPGYARPLRRPRPGVARRGADDPGLRPGPSASAMPSRRRPRRPLPPPAGAPPCALADRGHHLHRLRQRRGRAVVRGAGRACRRDERRDARPVRALRGLCGACHRRPVGDLGRGAAGRRRRRTPDRDPRHAPAIEAPAAPRPLPSPPRATVAFEDVHFAYPMRPDQKALRGASFSVEPGERVAIVGPSGAGKSTIFNLILRFYDPQSGRCADRRGRCIAEADPEEVRARIASVPQETMIFSTTVAENIRFGRPDASDAEIEAAADAAQAAEFIERLPQGFATRVGERGVMLSGGQRQRIAIARAILRDAPILLLDEATSALDAESESLVQTALERLMKGRTSLVIAHRLATVRTPTASSCSTRAGWWRKAATAN
jgi:ATP-binding cassette, subfamily B, bacterial